MSADCLAPDERRELERLAKLSAKDGGPAFVILPRELESLQRLDNQTLSAVIQEVALNFVEIDSGGAFDEKTKSIIARMTAAQAAYTEAWIKERKRRKLPIFSPTAPNQGRVCFVRGKAKGGAE